MKTLRKRLTLGKDTLARVTGGYTVVAQTGACPIIIQQTLRYTCLPAACVPAGTSFCTISAPSGGAGM